MNSAVSAPPDREYKTVLAVLFIPAGSDSLVQQRYIDSDHHPAAAVQDRFIFAALRSTRAAPAGATVHAQTSTEAGSMEEQSNGGNLKRAALYGVAGLMTAALGATAAGALSADEKKPEQKPVAQSVPPVSVPKPAEPALAPPPAPKPVTVPRAEVVTPVAQPAPLQVVQPVAQQPAVQPQVVHKPVTPKPLVHKPLTRKQPAAEPVRTQIVLQVAPAQPIKKTSPTAEALKKAKSEATEAKKKVTQAEQKLAEAKKDYSEKKAEIQKLQKQQNQERKAHKPKPPVQPVLTVKTSPDMEKRLQAHAGKHKPAKKKASLTVPKHKG
ncbi:hypothetical protein [Lentzea sp.]|uniref:hypothetical protein n=1 Tax=Lentzea sp. TaxID=56099 RepID=UPI002ED62399